MYKPPKTCVIGKNGFLGSHFFNHYKQFYPDIIGTTKEGEYAIDLSNPKVSFPLEGYSWALIAAGFATPQKCHKYPEVAKKCDIEGTLRLARELNQKDIIPIIFSTAYVFDGKEKQYFSDTPHSPVNIYGKLYAERERRLLDELKKNCLIVRTCRVYGEKKGDRTILDSMIDRLMHQQKIEAAVDQILQLVSVQEVIACISNLQNKNARGIYQICSKNGVSRYDVAKYLASSLELCEAMITPVKMSAFDKINRPRVVNMVSCFPVKSWKKGADCLVSQYRN